MSDVVAKEVCDQEFVRMCESRRLDLDESDMSKAEKAFLSGFRKLFMKAMQRGYLVVEENGDPVYTPPGGKPIRFHKPTGATFMTADEGKGNMESTVLIMAELTRELPSSFAKLDGPDFKFCAEMTKLFLGAG